MEKEIKIRNRKKTSSAVTSSLGEARSVRAVTYPQADSDVGGSMTKNISGKE